MPDDPLQALAAAGRETGKRRVVEQEPSLRNNWQSPTAAQFREALAEATAGEAELLAMLKQAWEAFKPDISFESFCADLRYLASPPDDPVYDPARLTGDESCVTCEMACGKRNDGVDRAASGECRDWWAET